MKGITMRLATGIAAVGMMIATGTAFAQDANTQVIDTSVMNLVQVKINENFTNKIAMDTMRNQFMSDPNVVGALEKQIIPEMQKQMMEKTKARIQSQQMSKMSSKRM
ncbi:MAG: hypothetical protein D3923_06005 [Candidatus Electrothrix sp. AR3]|nr:hypothetical protein [Candidatus Electrothrix sp. AR3]